jgi:hypothetical protein
MLLATRPSDIISISWDKANTFVGNTFVGHRGTPTHAGHGATQSVGIGATWSIPVTWGIELERRNTKEDSR